MESRQVKRGLNKRIQILKKMRRKRPKIQMPPKKDLKSYYNLREKTDKESSLDFALFVW